MNVFTAQFPAGRLDLEFCVSSGQVFRWQRLPDGGWLGVDGDQWYRVAATLAGPDARVTTNATGMNRDPDRNALAFVAERRTRATDRDMETLEVTSNGTRLDFADLFRLDWDAGEVEAEILRRGPELEPYLGTLSGLRLLRPSDATEMFFTFMCTPNNNLPRIVQMVRHLASFGPAMAEVEGVALHRFPSADVIAELPPSELRSRAFGYRASTIPQAAQTVVARGGDAYIRQLREASYEDAHEELVSIPNIGHKLADCIALFALHHTSAVPVDTHLWKAATRLYFPEWQGTNLTETKNRAVSAFIRGRFGDLTGWAHQYLFFDNVLNWRSRKAESPTSPRP